MFRYKRMRFQYLLFSAHYSFIDIFLMIVGRNNLKMCIHKQVYYQFIVTFCSLVFNNRTRHPNPHKQKQSFSCLSKNPFSFSFSFSCHRTTSLIFVCDNLFLKCFTLKTKDVKPMRDKHEMTIDLH